MPDSDSTVSKPAPQPGGIAIRVEGDGTSGSLTAAAFLSKLLDREGIPHRPDFGNPHQEPGFAKAKEKPLEELVSYMKQRDLVNLHPHLA